MKPDTKLNGPQLIRLDYKYLADKPNDDMQTVIDSLLILAFLVFFAWLLR